MEMLLATVRRLCLIFASLSLSASVGFCTLPRFTSNLLLSASLVKRKMHDDVVVKKQAVSERKTTKNSNENQQTGGLPVNLLMSLYQTTAIINTHTQTIWNHS